jgi:hypothetical protein
LAGDDGNAADATVSGVARVGGALKIRAGNAGSSRPDRLG